MEQKFNLKASDETIGRHKIVLEALELYSKMRGWMINIELKVEKQSSVWSITLTYENPNQIYWYGRLAERYNL